MDFHDFPRFPGKSGMDLMYPPKLCAGLADGVDVVRGQLGHGGQVPRSILDDLGGEDRNGAALAEESGYSWKHTKDILNLQIHNFELTLSRFPV